MQYEMNDDIIFETYNDNSKLKETILNFILNSDPEKILYKGNPHEINYKLIKKILPNQMIDSTNLRNSYEKFISNIECKNCLIYKK
jgi:hypothetical protein